MPGRIKSEVLFNATPQCSVGQHGRVISVSNKVKTNREVTVDYKTKNKALRHPLNLQTALPHPPPLSILSQNSRVQSCFVLVGSAFQFSSRRWLWIVLLVWCLQRLASFACFRCGDSLNSQLLPQNSSTSTQNAFTKHTLKL